MSLPASKSSNNNLMIVLPGSDSAATARYCSALERHAQQRGYSHVPTYPNVGQLLSKFGLHMVKGKVHVANGLFIDCTTLTYTGPQSPEALMQMANALAPFALEISGSFPRTASHVVLVDGKVHIAEDTIPLAALNRRATDQTLG